MKQNKDSGINAGVHANIGMDFQKNTTVYLFLEKYEKLKSKNYFIILEHHDDIVFGHLDEKGNLEKVETYQAKKSGQKWMLNKRLFEIIQKITESSVRINDDNHKKTQNFCQNNVFATNNTIELAGNNKVKELINEENQTVSYLDLHKDVQDKIKEGNGNFQLTETNIENLENLGFAFIDLSRTLRQQEAQLLGLFIERFNEDIHDCRAALKTFLYYLHKTESTFNQGKVARLEDASKRIESAHLRKLFDKFITQSRAYDIWREKGEEICSSLGVAILYQSEFQMHFQNSFEEFKDLKQTEHRKIMKYAENNKYILSQCTSDISCIKALNQKFDEESSTTLTDLQLKASIAAAYIVIKNTI